MKKEPEKRNEVPWYAKFVTKQHQENYYKINGHKCCCGYCLSASRDGWKPTA